jgi:UDP-N-acetylglucosamine--N-acetylmuramyl-(pentapeptide) pyrophosphoryl-undecaprenol N-acetylglucosamine transferase
LRALIVGGGTGGHVIPALAIARELKAQFEAEILFMGTPRGVENRMVPAAGFELKLVQVGALKNVSMATRFKTAFDLPKAILAASRIITDFKPTIVIGVGGYASGPGMIAAVLRRVPTLAFEPNLVPGFANKRVGKLVTAAAVQFEPTAKYFQNAQVTGVPIRKEFAQVGQPTEPNTVLVTGGSQGAQAINRAVVEALPMFQAMATSIKIVHQTGQKDFEATRDAYARTGVSAEVSPFVDDMAAAFRRASLLVCRSGASTVAEITAAGRVAIFIPFPHAADDHQKKNAEALVDAGAALMIEQKDLTAEKLFNAVQSLFSDPARLKQMSDRSRALAHPDAADRIAKLAYSIERKN